MKSFNALSLVIILGIVVGWVFHAERKEEGKPLPVAADAPLDDPLPGPSQEDVSLRKELAQLKDQVLKQQALLKQQARTALAARASTPVHPDRQDETGGDDAPSIPEMDPEEREAQERQHTEQIVSNLDDSLQSEPSDDSWAAQIEAGIAEDFRAGDWKGSKLQDANCRSTLCRLVVAHERLEAADGFVPRMGMLQAFANTEAFYQTVTLEDGTPATVIYLARQGHRLPAMPSP
jgi:hypothetical protein